MNKNNLAGKKILVTAGPTREAIDPIRFISNHSSGKMGYAIAEEFLQQGATVFLVSGPVCLDLEHPALTTTRVNSASEMYLACCRFFEEVDVAVFAASVPDYRPVRTATQKIKRTESSFSIKMVRNIDIASEFGKLKSPSQLSVGFAMETHDEIRYAEQKLVRKNFDIVILNTVNDESALFDQDMNKVTIIKSDLSRTHYPPKVKKEVAEDIVFEIGIALSHAELAEWEEKEQAYEMLYL